MTIKKSDAFHMTFLNYQLLFTDKNEREDYAQGRELPTFDEITAGLTEVTATNLPAAENTNPGTVETPFGEDLFYTRRTEAYLGDTACVGLLASKADDYDTRILPGE